MQSSTSFYFVDGMAAEGFAVWFWLIGQKLSPHTKSFPALPEVLQNFLWGDNFCCKGVNAKYFSWEQSDVVGCASELSSLELEGLLSTPESRQGENLGPWLQSQSTIGHNVATPAAVAFTKCLQFPWLCQPGYDTDRTILMPAQDWLARVWTALSCSQQHDLIAQYLSHNWLQCNRPASIKKANKFGSVTGMGLFFHSFWSLDLHRDTPVCLNWPSKCDRISTAGDALSIASQCFNCTEYRAISSFHYLDSILGFTEWEQLQPTHTSHCTWYFSYWRLRVWCGTGCSGPHGTQVGDPPTFLLPQQKGRTRLIHFNQKSPPFYIWSVIGAAPGGLRYWYWWWCCREWVTCFGGMWYLDRIFFFFLIWAGRTVSTLRTNMKLIGLEISYVKCWKGVETREKEWKKETCNGAIVKVNFP